MPRLALVVSTPVERGDFSIACALAAAARRRHVDVELFLMDAIVAGLTGVAERVAELADLGCELTVCASSAEAHGLVPDALPQLVFGSQDDHAASVHRADRVVAFT